VTPSRILVTGAAGFVGGHLLPRLAAAFPSAALVPCEVDIADADAVHSTVRECRPDAAIHLAAVSVVAAARAEPDLAWRVNLHGTLALARAIIQATPECLLLHISSADAYGRSFAAGTPVDEQVPLAPVNLYAATKAAADLALGALIGDGLRCVRLRPFNHTGPGQSADLVIAAFARQIARIEAGFQPARLRVGALDSQRDFLDVRDVCDAYIACLRHAESLPRTGVFNIASGVSRRIGDVLGQLLALAGITAEVETGSSLLRPSEIPLAVGNATAARIAFGWAPAIAWEQTLRDVLDDWRRRVHAD
jgi:GDP-4-dehydro-6-deoxy-D-mannose reductase